MREHLLASSKTLPYSMAFTYQCTFCCDHCMGPTSKSRYQQTSVSRLNLEFKILTKPGFRISPKIQLHYHFKTSAAKYWTNSCFKSCLNFNFKIMTRPFAQSLNKSLILWPNLRFHICNKLLPTRSSSSTSATIKTSTSFELASSKARVTSIKFTKQEWVSQSVSQLVSQSVSDKGKQWSDSGPIKTLRWKLHFWESLLYCVCLCQDKF